MKKINLISGSILTMMLATVGCVVEKPQAPAVVTVRHVQGPYQKPQLSPGAQFGALPPDVQNAVRAEAGTAIIDRVIIDRTPLGTVYKVHFQNSEVFPPLYVSPEGDVLNPDYTIAVPSLKASTQEFVSRASGSGDKVGIAELPEEVLKIIQQQSPRAEIDGIEKQSWGDRTVYIFTFKGENASPKLYVRSDGIVLKEVAK